MDAWSVVMVAGDIRASPIERSVTKVKHDILSKALKQTGFWSVAKVGNFY